VRNCSTIGTGSRFPPTTSRHPRFIDRVATSDTPRPRVGTRAFESSMSKQLRRHDHRLWAAARQLAHQSFLDRRHIPAPASSNPPDHARHHDPSLKQGYTSNRSPPPTAFQSCSAVRHGPWPVRAGLGQHLRTLHKAQRPSHVDPQIANKFQDPHGLFQTGRQGGQNHIRQFTPLRLENPRLRRSHFHVREMGPHS